MANNIGNVEGLKDFARKKEGTLFGDLKKLLVILQDFVDDNEIAVVYPRSPLVEPLAQDYEGICLELVIFTKDGKIIVASILPAEKFEIAITNKSEICGLNVSGYLSENEQEIMPALKISFKDGSQLDLNSEEDANEYWGEEYPELIRMIITQLR